MEHDETFDLVVADPLPLYSTSFSAAASILLPDVSHFVPFQRPENFNGEL